MQESHNLFAGHLLTLIPLSKYDLVKQLYNLGSYILDWLPVSLSLKSICRFELRKKVIKPRYVCLFPSCVDNSSSAYNLACPSANGGLCVPRVCCVRCVSVVQAS